MSSYDHNYDRGPSPGPGPGSPWPRPPRRDTDWDGVSWVLGMILTVAVGPLGLFLTFAHATGHDILGALLRGLFGTRQRREKTAPSREPAAAGAPKKTAAKPAGAEKQPAKKAAGAEERFPGARRADKGATVKTVAGWILVAFGLLAVIGAVSTGEGLWPVLSMLSIALGGGVLVGSGIFSRRKEAKFRRCFAVSGSEGVVDIRKMAKTMGIDAGEADKLFSEMVDRGYYGEKAYVDHGRGLLVIDVEDMRDVYRREDEAKAREESAQAQEKMNEYERYVERIRQADVDIEDEAMSEKIRRMQSLTASIFAEVEAHPEKKPQIDRFMNYYLPTTLKLLDSYARIEEQGVSGENMAKAKADIERIADTLVEGYEKQLDKLYRAEAMDIAGDVSVIENMMERDGLSGRPGFSQTAGGQTAGGH